MHNFVFFQQKVAFLDSCKESGFLTVTKQKSDFICSLSRAASLTEDTSSFLVCISRNHSLGSLFHLFVCLLVFIDVILRVDSKERECAWPGLFSWFELTNIFIATIYSIAQKNQSPLRKDWKWKTHHSYQMNDSFNLVCVDLSSKESNKFFFKSLHICISSLKLENCIFAACKILCSDF